MLLNYISYQFLIFLCVENFNFKIKIQIFKLRFEVKILKKYLNKFRTMN